MDKNFQRFVFAALVLVAVELFFMLWIMMSETERRVELQSKVDRIEEALIERKPITKIQAETVWKMTTYFKQRPGGPMDMVSAQIEPVEEEAK